MRLCGHDSSSVQWRIRMNEAIKALSYVRYREFLNHLSDHHLVNDCEA
jgi:hypothetical protein